MSKQLNHATDQSNNAGMRFIVIGLGIILATAVVDSMAIQPDGVTSRQDSSVVTERQTKTSSATLWDAENSYWFEHFRLRPYYRANTPYSDYESAYRYGLDAYHIYEGKRFDDIDENSLRAGWERVKGRSSLVWENAKAAVRDAYERLLTHVQ